MKKAILIIISLIFFVPQVYAITLTEALTQAYKNNPELNAERESIKVSEEDLNISILNKFVGDQYMSNTESVVSKLGSYSTTDLNFIYSFKKSKYFNEIIFTAMLNNIFNKEYVSNGCYYTYDDTWSDPNMVTTIEGTGYYPQAKRNFLIGFTFKL